MKTIYFLLLVSLNALANISVKETSSIVNFEGEIKQIVATANPKPKNSSISGLKIVTCESQKYGKHIYIVSDMYVKKKINFYNAATGGKVYSIATVGSPIYLSKIKKGTYKVKITEGKKTEIKDLIVN